MGTKINLLSAVALPALAVGVGSFGITASSSATSLAQPVAEVASCAPANPCAAVNPCAAANPCAAKTPCAASNPCAANPCAGWSPASSTCYVPRLAAAKENNPCAATNPCTPNPCAANPCATANPCAAARATNPCATDNPCSANPCSPCGAMDVADITDEEAIAMWDCLIDEMRTSWGQSGNPSALSFDSWRSFSSSPYPSATHGSRYVMNYANDTGSGGYGAYEDVGTMPEGSILAKPSFTVDSSGRAAAGPLFLMEKMQSGFFAEANDWKYTMIMPNGSISGTSKGKGSANVEFCVACHMAAPDTDHLFFLPDEYRK